MAVPGQAAGVGTGGVPRGAQECVGMLHKWEYSLILLGRQEKNFVARVVFWGGGVRRGVEIGSL